MSARNLHKFLFDGLPVRGVINAAGGATTMWVDFPNQKSKTMPDWLRQIVS